MEIGSDAAAAVSVGLDSRPFTHRGATGARARGEAEGHAGVRGARSLGGV